MTTAGAGTDGTARAAKRLDTAAMPWRDFQEAPGVSFKVLRTHRPGTGVTLLLRFAPGAAYPAHRHPAGEEYYVLEGDLVDGGAAYGAGTYVSHPPGSIHRPTSRGGGVVLVFLPEGIEIVSS
jgi:anti-sigma factor ChrR (cupin superfamily)